jgi:hypothetical protein
MSFFPSGIELSDIRSPHDILEEARAEWLAYSNGQLDLCLSEAVREDFDELIWDLFVHHTPSKRLAKILSVAHRPANPYPVEVRPEAFDLPRYLRKRYIVPRRRTSGSFSFSDRISDLAGILPEPLTETVTNEWVCDNPAEFREKLQKALTLGSVEALINNLISGPPDEDTQGPIQDSGIESDASGE